MGSVDTDSPKPTHLVMRVWAFTETVVSGDNVPNIAKDSSTHKCFDIVSTGKDTQNLEDVTK